MKVRLKLVCPSNEDSAFHFYSEKCRGAGCTFWGKMKSGGAGCTAGEDLAETFGQWLRPDRDASMPACSLTETCAWNVNAIARGEPGCTPRRLGLTCEHQGGEWNTFQMAEPDDPCWGEDDPRYEPDPDED